MLSKKKVLKKLKNKQEEVINKMVDEYMSFLSKFDKETMIKDITREDVERIAKSQFENILNKF